VQVHGSQDRTRPPNGIGLFVVLANSNLIVVFPSIPLRVPIVRSLNRTLRLLSEPCGAAA